jgi:putative ABC transport system permease protein
MIKNYFKIVIRSLFKNRTYSLINVLGLTFGLTCFMLIGLYLFDELTFDRQHKNADHIYRVVGHKKNSNEDLTIAAGSFMLAEQSKRTIPEIANTARFTRTGRANMKNTENENTFYQTVTIANNGFMELFDFKAVAGNPKTALKEPNSIVIVEDLAKQFFNSTDVVGKTVQWEFMETPLKITAVIKNHPRNSSFDFSSVYSEATIMSDTGFANRAVRDWTSDNYSVYALLKEGSDPSSVSQKINKLVNTNATLDPGSSVSYSLQALKDIHLRSEGIVDGARNSNVEAINNGSFFYIKIFGLVALFVLFIACINYMNLTTAKASSRSKEIGVRKTSGAYRGQLIRQFMLESVLISLVSFLLAVCMVNLLLPAFNRFTNKELTLGYHTDYRIWMYSILAAVITGILSGSYPAFILSRFNPVLLIKGVKLQSKNDLSLRRGLVVFQFTISVVMIIATLVLFLQVRYINNKDLGFNKDMLLVVDINSGRVRNAASVINSEFSKIPHVKNVSTTSRVPGEWKTIPTIKMRNEGNTDDYKISYFLGIDEHFSNTFQVQLLKGRNFADRNDSASVILNESAAKILNITEATGQVIEVPMLAFGGSYFNLRNNQVFKAKVIGIAKDFNFQSLREKIAPLVMGYQYNPVHVIDYFTSKIDGKDIDQTLEKMKEVLAKIDINHLFEYHFLDQQLEIFYREDVRRQKILIWSALAAIFIACMGLFGLATYAAEQRIKEIGVRKVLGASVTGITALLSKDFIKLVIISIVVASPIAYLLMNKWLQEFAYRIKLDWWVFVLSGLVALTIALVTVSFQAVKAAIANPVKSLRTE